VRIRTPLVIAISAALAAGGATAGPLAGPVDPSRFVTGVDNPWFPLRPGTTFVFRGVKDGEPSRDVVVVTHATRTIAGVRCTAVSDRLFLSGRLAERTTDWFAQDRSGAVWYFGEATAELDRSGRVTSTEGSWRTGLHGALPGVVMAARPRVGQSFAQEHYPGHAEDHFRVLSLSAPATTPAVTSRHALLTKEWTPLEPGVVDHKLYVRGIGMVEEQTIRGGDEHAVLVSVRRG